MAFTWQGQSCGSTSRLLVHRSLHEEFVARLGERMDALRSGLAGGRGDRHRRDRPPSPVREGARLPASWGARRAPVCSPAEARPTIRRWRGGHVRAADAVRQRAPRFAARAGGDLRPGARRDAVRDLRRGAGDRQRRLARPDREHLHARPRDRPPLRPRRRGRLRLGQRHPDATSRARPTEASRTPASGARRASRSSSPTRRSRTSTCASGRIAPMLRKDAKLELIRSVPLFAHCTKKELTAVASVADHRRRPGGPGPRQGGRLAGSRVHGHRRRGGGRARRGRRIATLGSGDFFGEMALLAHGPRSATVTSTRPSELLVVTPAAFHALLERLPSLQSRVLMALAQRLHANSV